MSFSKPLDYVTAAEIMQQEYGKSVEVINLGALSLDTDTIVASLKKTNRLVTVEEGHAGGWDGNRYF